MSADLLFEIGTEEIPAGFVTRALVQLEQLAPVIGTRSWGGVVGIRGDKLLVDGGFLTEPEFAWWDPKLGWDLENRGVEPDIEVQNLPQDLALEIDTQLDFAIQEVLRLHRESYSTYLSSIQRSSNCILIL